MKKLLVLIVLVCFVLVTVEVCHGQSFRPTGKNSGNEGFTMNGLMDDIKKAPDPGAPFMEKMKQEEIQQQSQQQQKIWISGIIMVVGACVLVLTLKKYGSEKK